MAKLVEIEHTGHQLKASLAHLRAWVEVRQAGEDPGLRLLDCTLWAQQVGWLCTQAQIIAKGEEK